MSPTDHLTLEPSGSGIGAALRMIAGSGVAPSVRKRLAAPCVLLGMSLATAAAHAGGEASCADAAVGVPTVASMTAEAAEPAREMVRGNRSAGTERPALGGQGEPGPIPDLAELRASTDLRQKWRLGLALADLAVQTTVPSTRSKLMSEAQSVALGLVGIGMKDWLLAEIVERQIASGNIAAARETTALIHHPGWKADSLVLIALAGQDGGTDAEDEAQRLSDRNAALCAALKIPDPEWRAAALSSLL